MEREYQDYSRGDNAKQLSAYSSGDTTSPHYDRSRGLTTGPSPGYHSDGVSKRGFINLAMDDAIGSEEPDKVMQVTGSRYSQEPGRFQPYAARAELTSGKGKRPVSNTVKGPPSGVKDVTEGRPFFMVWIVISCVLTFTTLIGLLPLVYFWKAMFQWDSGNTAGARRSLLVARVGLAVIVLALAAGVTALVLAQRPNDQREEPSVVGQGHYG